MQIHLDFEEPINELQQQIEALRRLGNEQGVDISDELKKLEAKCHQKSQDIFKNLHPHQIVQLARHPLRPHSLDLIEGVCDDFIELHGDRCTSQASAIVGGLARFNGQSVVVLGHEKGRTTKEKCHRNFGMPNPEDFRKSLRLFKMAEKFQLPVITFIDTPGAYPGIDAEERNQSEAIARNLLEMSKLKTPIISVIIGEGCSGGALGIGVGDALLMLEYSYFAVISPEGCASILWKDAARASDAAQEMNLTAPRLLELGLIDDMITEPVGGGHRNPEHLYEQVSVVIARHLAQCRSLSLDELVERRYNRLMMSHLWD